jgi:hypothetical protein
LIFFFLLKILDEINGLKRFRLLTGIRDLVVSPAATHELKLGKGKPGDIRKETHFIGDSYLVVPDAPDTWRQVSARLDFSPS